MKKNLVLETMLNDLFDKNINLEEDLVQPNLDDYFLSRKYHNLSKDFIKKVINCEIGENILGYGMQCSKLGFQAGIDLMRMIEGSDPVYGILDNLSKGGFTE